MREILFRGKDVYTDDWVVGYYEFGFDSGTEEPTYYIWTVNHSEKEGELFMVDPETIGQSTGLTDKNGKRIFEGDIVEGLDFTMDDGGYGVVSFDDGAFEVNGNNISGTFHENYWGAYFEVIGNIHDNPELLKGVGDDR